MDEGEISDNRSFEQFTKNGLRMTIKVRWILDTHREWVFNSLAPWENQVSRVIGFAEKGPLSEEGFCIFLRIIISVKGHELSRTSIIVAILIF